MSNALSRLNFFKKNCKIDYFLDVVDSIMLLSNLSPDEKVQEFQRNYRIYGNEFIWFDSFLKKLVGSVKEEDKENGSNQKNVQKRI